MSSPALSPLSYREIPHISTLQDFSAPLSPMSYSHFSSSERLTLYQLRNTEKLSMSMIAIPMKRSKSSISRELRRNRIDETLYLPDTAQVKMETRRQQSKQQFMSISASTVNEVKQRLVQESGS